MKQFAIAIGCAICLALAGCSETPTKTAATKKAEEKPPEPVTGRDALYKIDRKSVV